ncbi:hypothetical protein LLH23_18380 [bacterium]|nr:hypothetical protein [bacterium]
MTKAHAFFRQAASDFRVFELLLSQPGLPQCHALHYLQMASEKLAKAIFLAGDPSFNYRRHAVLRNLHQPLRRQDVCRMLGFGSMKQYEATLNGLRPVLDQIEHLCPAVDDGAAADTTPNVEYPWLGRDGQAGLTWLVPADHQFELVAELLKPRHAGLTALQFIALLLERLSPIIE